MRTSVTIGTSKFFVICQKHCKFNFLNLLVNSVLPLVSVFMAFARKCFTQSLAELPSYKISAAQPVLREETTLLIIKIQLKIQLALHSIYWKIMLWKIMSECFLILFL